MPTYSKTLQTINLLRYKHGGTVSVFRNQSIQWTVPIRAFKSDISNEYAYTLFSQTIDSLFPHNEYYSDIDAKNNNYVLTLSPIGSYQDFSYIEPSKDNVLTFTRFNNTQANSQT